MDDYLKLVAQEVEDAHDHDSALAGYMLLIAAVSERLDASVRLKNQENILLYELMLQHYARGMRRIMRAMQLGDEPSWPPAGWRVTRNDGESHER